MALDLGLLLAESGKAAGRYGKERRARKLEDAIRQEKVEDRAQQAADRQRRASFEDVIRGRETEKYEYAIKRRPFEEELERADLEGKRAQTAERRSQASGTTPLDVQRKSKTAEDEATSAVRAAGGDPGKADQMLARSASPAWKGQNLDTRIRLLQTAAERHRREKEGDKMRGGLLGAIAGRTAGAPAAPGGYANSDDARADYDEQAAKLKAAGLDPEQVLGPRP